MLSIFNNGSQAWILFFILVFWTGYWGWKTYTSHKSGYHRQLPGGGWKDELKALGANGNFWFALLGVVGIIVAIIVINADYR